MSWRSRIKGQERDSVSKYDDYTREDLIRLINERDRKPKLGLLWERDEIDHDRSVNSDFVVLDIDPKLSCGDDTLDKTTAEHRHYGVPLMLALDNDRFMTVKYNEKSDKNNLDQIFRIENLAGY